MLRSEKYQYHNGIQFYMNRVRFDHAAGEYEPSYLPMGTRGRCVELHGHEDIELIRVEEGRLFAELDGREYVARPGDIVAVNPYVEHIYYTDCSDDRLIYQVVLFSPRYFIPMESCELGTRLNKLIAGKRRFREFLGADLETTSVMRQVIDHYMDYYRRRDKLRASCMLFAGAYELLGLLLDEDCGDIITSSILTKRDIDFVNKSIGWVNRNYHLPVSTSDICSDFGYNVSHFCRMFHDNFGTSFMAYLREYRIHRATTDYKESKLPVSAIAAAVGFGDCCYFSRAFKKQVGVSPRKYFLK